MELLTPEEVKEAFTGILEDNQALTLVLDYKRNIGVATKDVKGYTKSLFYIHESLNYKQKSKIIREANRLLFPNRGKFDSDKIVLSSMFKK